MRFNLALAAVLGFSSVSLAKNASCPPSPVAIDPMVQSTVKFDKKSRDYTYTIKLRNGPKAEIPFYMFRFESSEVLSPLKAPKNWNGRALSNGEEKDANDVDKYDISLMTVEDDLAPGSSARTFVFKSKLSPGWVKYYAEGDPGSVRKGDPTAEDPEEPPVCPGFLGDGASANEQRVTGVMIGPVPSSQLDVKLRMKVKKKRHSRHFDDEAEDPEISPEDEGTVELVMLPPKGFDLAKVDLRSVVFGPYEVAPKSIKLVSKGHQHFRHWRKKPRERKKMIWMEFDLKDINIRCDLDKALVLRASDLEGEKDLVGAVDIKPSVCSSKTWKKYMKKRSDWRARHKDRAEKRRERLERRQYFRDRNRKHRKHQKHQRHH